MIFTKIYDPNGEYVIHFAHDDYDGILKFLGNQYNKSVQFKAVNDLVFGEAFEFPVSIKIPPKDSIEVRTPYEEISNIFDELSEMILLCPDFKQPKKQWRKWNETLLDHGWTEKEWKTELDKRLNEKYHIFSEKEEEDDFEGIIITNNSIIRSYWKAGRQEQIIAPDKLIHFIWENVRLNDDVTLGRIFDIVENNIDLWEIITGERIKPIIEESKKEFSGSGELKYLEIYWDVEHDAEYETLTSWPSFHAIGEPCEDDYLPEGLNGLIYYGISFTPNNYLKTLKLRLKNVFKIYSSDDFHDKQYFGNKQFKVLETMKAIFWELTWFGTPEERDEKRIEIIGDIVEMKEVKEKETPSD